MSPPVHLLAVAALAAAPLIAFGLADTGGRRLLWDNLHWVLTAIAAAVASASSVRGTTGRVRIVRASGALFLGLWLVANLVWSSLALTGTSMIPSIADAFVLAALVPGLALIVIAVHGRVTAAEEATVYLDSGVAFLLIASLLVVVHGRTAVELPSASAVLALAYPIAFIGLGVAGLIALVAARYPVAAKGALPLAIGTTTIGVAYLWWIAPTATGSEADDVASALFSIGTLIAAYGVTTWDDTVESDRPSLARAGFLSRSIGPAAAGALVLTILLPADPSVERLIELAVVIGGGMFVTRAALLLRERTLTLAQVTELKIENERLVAELRLELERRDRDQASFIEASRSAAVGDLAAGVAHEVNNPLTGVLGYSELVLAQIDEADPLWADLETIRAEALRARTIIRGLIDFARPHAPALVETDLAEVVRQAVDLVRYPLDRRGIRITERYEPMTPVLVDPHAVQQSVLNVLTNAGQALADEGHLEVSVEASDGVTLIRIVDDGAGMDDATAAQAFEPFFAGPSDDGRARTGLGLSVARGLIDALGGTIRLDSGPGRGTTAEIRLPSPVATAVAFAGSEDRAE